MDSLYNLDSSGIEFIKTNHSIQDAAALAIYSPAGIVVHTGDFKVDIHQSLEMLSIFRDLQRLEKKEYWHFCQTVPMRNEKALHSLNVR